MLAAGLSLMLSCRLGMTLSGLADTAWEALFITTCALTSLSLFNIERWRVPAIFILLVAAFPVHKYATAHYVFSFLFFVSSYWQLATARRFGWLAWTAPVACVMPVLFGFGERGVLYFELVAIPTVLAHHVLYLVRRVSTFRRRGGYIRKI